MKNFNWKRFAITWTIFFLLFVAVTKWFGGEKPNPEAGAVSVETAKDGYVSGQEVSVRITNNADEDGATSSGGAVETRSIELEVSCPKNPFKVLKWNGNEYEEISAETKSGCEGVETTLVVMPQKSGVVSYKLWNFELFGEPGRYKIEVPVTMTTKSGGETKNFSTPEFIVKERGVFRRTWDNLFYKPIFNALVSITDNVPWKDLGLGIIILTIVIRLILLVPSQRAMKAQKRLQEVQPKLEALKKQYAGNQERIAQETMALWKREKVNPFGSCLPLLIQFPFLIAIFYVIQNGIGANQAHFLYESLKTINFESFHTNFLGILELTRVNVFVLPLIVGLLQFAQMKLAMPNLRHDKAASPSAQPEMQMANKMMIYILPVMIAIFTASVPAGVGLYWGVSTLFALGQQLVVNRAKLKA